MKDIKSFKSVWYKIMCILTPVQKKLGVVVLILLVFSSFVEMLGVSVIIPLMEAILEPQEAMNTPILKVLGEYVAIDSDNELRIIIIVTVIIVYIFKNCFLTFVLWIRTKYSMKVQRELSLLMVNSYNIRGYAVFRNVDYPVYYRGVNVLPASINNSIVCFFKLVSEILTISCIFLLIIIADVGMFFTLLGLAIICVAAILLGFRGIIRKAGEDNHKNITENIKWLIQLYYGIQEILVMNRENFFATKYEKTNYKVQKTTLKLMIAQEVPTYLIEMICVIGLMISVGIKITTMQNPVQYLPVLAAVAMAAFRILPSLGRISSNFNGLLFQIPYINEAYDNVCVAKESMSGTCIEDYARGNVNNGSGTIHFENELLIDGVSFGYDEEKILDDINIKISKGDAVAFVGASGSGKSTLAYLILGLLKPQSGSVIFDGIDIIKNKSIWSQIIGFVPQTPYLASDNIRNNVAFGLDDEEIDDMRIWNALERAQIKSFVETLPDGLNTMLGERGVRVSGGQAQRIAIARALYNEPDVLVLDEATSALDKDTERAVMDAIDSLKGSITLVIIAHRLTTIKNCNKIYEIRDKQATLKTYEEII